MRIALFSDIHANLPALEAFFTHLDASPPDALYCLGDLVGYNVWPNEVIREIRRRGIPTLAGNYDVGVGLSSDDCGCAYKTEEDKKRGEVSIAVTNRLIGDEERHYLRTLPAHIRLTFQLNATPLDLLLVHGSPRKVNEYLFEDRDEKSLSRILETAETDILCFGHTHIPYHRVLEYETEGRKAYRHAINLGSLGKPKDGDARGCFVILTLDENSSRWNRDSLQVEFIRIPYDVERAAQALENSELPRAFADMLRKAY